MILITREEMEERCERWLDHGLAHGVAYFLQKGGVTEPVTFYPYDREKGRIIGRVYMELLPDGIVVRRKAGP